MCLIVILGSGCNQSLVEYQKVTPHVNLNKFVVKIEINHSTNFNDFYPKTAQVGDPNYAGGSEGSSQPAVIYAAQIDRTSGQKQFQANMSARCAVGIGIGLSGYEKALVPLYGTVKFRITRPHPFTPFVEGAAGRAFALAKNAKGGFSLSFGWNGNPASCPNKDVGSDRIRAAEIKKIEKTGESGCICSL